MEETSEKNDLNYYINWLDNSIAEEHIKYYEFSDFTNIQQIGKGSYGNVIRVNWKNSSRPFALKSFNNDKQTLKEVVKELKLHRSVDDHENIIRLYGITKFEDTVHQMKYSLVLEYANNGTLNTYLSEYFHELDWNEKLLLALQLANAVGFLHEKDIIHRDLHPNNILVHQKNIKLADFGLSKKIAEASSNASKIIGVIPFIDPERFNNQGKTYKLNKKSDVYSVGVLLWQISSGYEPFKGFVYDACLMLYILKGKREETIVGTPVKYYQLYSECWKRESNERPDMQKVVTVLESIISSEQNDVITHNVNEKKELEEYNSNLNKGTIDINNDLMNDITSLNIKSGIVPGSGIISSSSVSNQAVKQSVDYTRNDIINDVTSLNVKSGIVPESGSSVTNQKTEQSVDYTRNDIINDVTSLNIKSGIIISNISNRATEPLIDYTRAYKSHLLLELEKEGLITPDDKVEELLKNLAKPKYLYALKLLFENPQNEFPSEILINSLKSLANPGLFDYYSKDYIARLELHLRTWVAVLERIQFSYPPITFSKDLQDKVSNSLAKFAEIYYKTTQVVDGNLKLKFRQEDKMNNYNIDFLLIQLRDTLNSLRDDESWLQELLKRIKDLLNTVLNIIPSPKATIPNDDCTILSLLTQVRQSLNFKYPVASYYINWRIILIIQHNLFVWSEGSEKIISKKFGEMVLMEYIWSFIEREWVNAADKSILDSQTKFDEISNKVIKTLKNTGSFLNDFSGNEPIALPHTLWFGILDLAQNLIRRSTRTATYGLCYYLAIESLNKAPSNFIQFKAIEILLHLFNIDNKMFSMIEIDFEQYTKKLNENNLTNSLEKFRLLLTFVKEKYLEDLKILSNDTGKGKEGKGKDLNQDHLKREQILSSNILDVIAYEITCPISSEPTDQLCVLKCQHTLSLNNLKKLKQKVCPKCREKFENENIRYLPQNSIYKNLYAKFFESGHILPSIELENSDQIMDNQYDSDDLDNSEVDPILTKKRKFINSIIKLGSNISLSSVFPRITKKQYPAYQNIIKEINEKHYEKAEYLCKEFLNFFPKSYSLRCILAYISRCLNNYEQAHLYLKKAIDLNPKRPVAFLIRGEIYFRQNKYRDAMDDLNKSIVHKAKLNNLYVILGNSYLLYDDYLLSKDYYYTYYTLKNYNIALENDSNNYLCLKSCAYCYEKQGDYLNTLKILDKLLNINEKDSLVLCYYGEILCNMIQYSKAISYFTKANIIDPENIHNLIKRAIAYYNIQEYDEVLSDLNKIIQLDPLNSSAYYLRSLTYYTKNDINNASISSEKYIKLSKLIKSDDRLAKIQLFHLEYLISDDSYKKFILKRINQELKGYVFNRTSSNSSFYELLFYIRYRICIELKKYREAMLVLDVLLLFDYKFASCIQLLQRYPDFYSYLFEIFKFGFYHNLAKFGITNEFSKYMYTKCKIYFISNLTNLNKKLSQFQESNSCSLLGQILCSKNGKLHLDFPPYLSTLENYYIWKINIKKILSKDCFIKYIYKNDYNYEDNYILKYKDISEIEGLGWIEYTLPTSTLTSRVSVDVNSIDMQMDYVRFKVDQSSVCDKIITCIPNVNLMDHILPDYHKICPNIPETYKDKYFSRKEMENLLDLKDILNNL
ncbi:hypothetical protein RclHR1_00780003 [Rhizophagus clarus]|uniref:Protein kinase domain-containing protein n=1 Tax=Rhizophagus clarus TaxID=94130 RepID=A0A2Z6S4T5_9GLOM|nr:hypothetical protein RclHR1_00780003 [Rhizophagus clarus]GES87381.1 hypothetical protein GLOIN_2v1869755 [Rhizophagus clarus]